MQKMNFLMPLSGSATKEFKMEDGEWVLAKNYKSGKFFKGFEIEVECLVDCYETLKENQEMPCFMIHGAIIDGVDKSRMIRRKRADHKDGRKPTITDRPLHLFCLDIDGFKDYTDINQFINEHLPVEFHTADYIYQYSSSYGLTAHDLRCHIFFWLENPVHNLDIVEWIKSYNKAKGWGRIIDESVLRAAQPVYIQKRICIDGEDPIEDFIGLVKKSGSLNWVPDNQPVVDKETGNLSGLLQPVKKSDYDLKAGIESILTAENYHDELNKLALSLINRKVPPKTVKQLLEGAMNAAEKKDKRWQERFDDIGRAVDSAAEIVDNPTIEEVLMWINNEAMGVVQTGFAQKCTKLSPLDKTVAVNEIARKTGFGVADIKKTIKIAEQEEKEEAKEAAKEAISQERESRGVYEIEVTPINTGEVAERVCDILSRSDKKPNIYSMGSHLVSVNMGSPSTIRQCAKLDALGKDYPKMPIIVPYRKPYYTLGGRMEQDIVFQNEKGNDIECPTRILHMVGESTYKHFKPLTGIAEHPFIDNEWKLVQKEGYNSRTGLYTMLHRKLKVSKYNSKEAYEYLAYTVFDEFPFNSELDRAVAVAALMTAVQRPTISGDSGFPGFGIISPTQSSGKTTLAQLISYSIFNRPVAAATLPEDEVELEKHLVGILQEGHSCVLFDNIKQGSNVTSDTLAKAMSSDSFRGRQLGENRTVQVPTSVVWMFTGNGISFVGDFATRVYPITINPNMEDPNTRRFKREDIGQWAMDNRKKIISAVLSIIVDGKGAKFGDIGASRFKDWDTFVRRPLLAVSGIDVNDAVKINQKEDPIYAAKWELLNQLDHYFPDGEEFTTKDIIQKAGEKFDGENNSLDAALDELYGNKRLLTVSLGRYLAVLVGVVFGGLTLTKKVSNKIMWRVKKI